MTSGVRFGAAHARMHALKRQLWTPLDRHLVVGAGVEPDGRALAGTPAGVFPGLVRWYTTFIAIHPTAATLLRALFRRHDVENLKLLWRAAVRGRAPLAQCWRPLEPLGVVAFSARVSTPQELVHQLDATPYGEIARALMRSHAADLPATEIGLDRWVWNAIADARARLPAQERGAADLVRTLTMEHDVDLLRRGVSVGLQPDLVAKSTVVLSKECRIGLLSAAAAWRPEDGPLARVLPRPLTRVSPDAHGWDDVVRALRRARLRECRRAFVGWPFRLAPAVAALLLREEQAQAAMSIAAARAHGRRALDDLPLALAASALEA
jgi:ATP synthase (C/AC39) subunit